MTREQLKICDDLFRITKEQFYAGIIDRENYLETLILIKEKIKFLKKGFDKKDFIIKTLEKPIMEINIKETINFVLAMN